MKESPVSTLTEQLNNGALLLAPLTKGGNLPYRRLCVDFGADITLSEMAFARKLIKGDRKERALLRRHPSEKIFGVQIAARKPDEALEAGKIVEDSGADFIDLNCGCPIYETTRRGLGATLLEKPNVIGAIVHALATNLSIPVTVKIRTGIKESKVNASNVARIAEESGATAVTIHGRTKEQRYSKAADWELISQIQGERNIPIIGNGDIIYFAEAEYHRSHHHIPSLMLGRGALIKPWLFNEIKEGKEWQPSDKERVGVLFQFIQYLKEHFGDDELGLRRIGNFLPWHLGLFCRYVPFTDGDYSPDSSTPLIHRRESLREDASLLTQLLFRTEESIHQTIAKLLCESHNEEEVLSKLLDYASELDKIQDNADSTDRDFSQTDKFAAG